MEFVRRGRGPKLLMVHGLGGSAASWKLITLALAEHRELILVDLPGHGRTPAGPGAGTFAGIAAALEDFLVQEDLVGADMVGVSLGGRLVLEMARRGRAGAVVALAPGGFWAGWERAYVRTTMLASINLLRALAPAVPVIAHSPAARTLLLAQLSAQPWDVNGDVAETELSSYLATRNFDELLDDLASGPMQEGPAAGSAPVTIGWGRHDRLCLPVQASRAQAAFPSARLHWFERSGHFPLWDEPDETLRVFRSGLLG